MNNMKYTIQEIIKLLKDRIEFEQLQCESMEGDDNDRQMSFIDGMEYALQIVTEPFEHGIENIKGYDNTIQ